MFHKASGIGVAGDESVSDHLDDDARIFETSAATSPSAATRSAFFAALRGSFAQPVDRRFEPLSVWVSAALQSIMPAPVLAQFLHKGGGIVAMAEIPSRRVMRRRRPTDRRARLKH
jgi:hypothetical protein